MGDATIADELYSWFGQVLERYSLPRGFSGSYNEADFDFFRFVGHELFVTLFAFLLREQQWGIISKLLGEPIPVATFTAKIVQEMWNGPIFHDTWESWAASCKGVNDCLSMAIFYTSGIPKAT